VDQDLASIQEARDLVRLDPRLGYHPEAFCSQFTLDDLDPARLLEPGQAGAAGGAHRGHDVGRLLPGRDDVRHDGLAGMRAMRSNFDAIRQLQIGNVYGMAQFQLAQIHFDEGWQIGWQAGDVQIVDHVADLAAAGLHAGSDFLVQEVQRHLLVHLVCRIDALEVDVLHLLAERVHHEVAQQHGFLLAFDVQRQHGSVERLGTQLVVDVVVVQFEHHGIAGTVDNAWHAAGVTQTAARTRTLRLANCCIDFDSHFTSPKNRTLRDQRVLTLRRSH